MTNNRFDNFVQGSRVVATSAVMWLTVAAVVIQSVIAETGSDWPWIADYGSRALVVIAAVITVIRRVTPVPKTERRVLP